jgi:hypothetical protein
MAAFIAVGLIVQTLYFLIDLYFVARLGKEAVAGVSASGASWMLATAASQLIAVGSLSLIARALGGRNPDDARLVFSQAVALSLLFGVVTLAVGWSLGPLALSGVGADAATVAAGRSYLFAFLPALALMFPISAISAGLRAAGVVGAPMAIASGSVALNALLAPVLINGWGPAPALGVGGRGAGQQHRVAGRAAAAGGSVPAHAEGAATGRPRPRPSPGGVAAHRRHRAAGGGRVLRDVRLHRPRLLADPRLRVGGAGRLRHRHAGDAVDLPARDGHRLRRRAHRRAELRRPERAPGTRDLPAGGAPRQRADVRAEPALPRGARGSGGALHLRAAVASVAVEYLQIISWNFVAVGLVFACSGMFQALGDTRPALLSSAVRLLGFAVPALWIIQQPGAGLRHLWYASVGAVLLQAAVSLWLLRGQFRRKLGALEGAGGAAAGAVPDAAR